MRLRVSKPEYRWYVAGLGDGMTHRGYWSPVTRSVHAACGAEFQPPGYLLDGLPGYPPDSDQVCPECLARISR